MMMSYPETVITNYLSYIILIVMRFFTFLQATSFQISNFSFINKKTELCV